MESDAPVVTSRANDVVAQGLLQTPNNLGSDDEPIDLTSDTKLQSESAEGGDVFPGEIGAVNSASSGGAAISEEGAIPVPAQSRLLGPTGIVGESKPEEARGGNAAPPAASEHTVVSAFTAPSLPPSSIPSKDSRGAGYPRLLPPSPSGSHCRLLRVRLLRRVV